MIDPFWAVVGGMLAVVLVTATLAIRRDGRRRAEVQAIGDRLGLDYQRRSTSLLAQLSDVPSMATAPHQSFTHVLRGPDTIVCDWAIVRVYEKRKRRKAQTIVAARATGANWPPFRVLGRGVSRSSLALMAVGLEEVPSSAARRAGVHVEGMGAGRVEELFDDERLGALRVPDGWVLEGGGEWLVGFVPGRLQGPREWAQLLEEARMRVAVLSDR